MCKKDRGKVPKMDLTDLLKKLEFHLFHTFS